MTYLKSKLRYFRYELIYLLGGVPEEHINTLNYKNVEAVFKNLREKIENANPHQETK